MIVGARINDVLTETEKNTGAMGMRPGMIVTDHAGSQFMCCKVLATQNVVNGNVIWVDANYGATIIASGPPTPSGTGMAVAIGVAVNSITASTSQFFFAQIFGPGNVRVTDTTASNLPGHILVVGSTPGELKGAAPTASAYVAGIVLTATASTATLSACFINFPKIGLS